MKEVSPSKASNSKETIADNEAFSSSEKIKKIFKNLDPKSPPEVCPIRDVLAPVSDKWSVLIVIFLGLYRVLRFNELKRNIYGISSKILSERLKSLERDGYIHRKVIPEVPIRVEYRLSSFGEEYLDKLLGLMEWIEQSMPQIIKNRKGYNSK